MNMILSLQALDVADTQAAANSATSICCAGCNSLASTGGCGKTALEAF